MDSKVQLNCRLFSSSKRGSTDQDPDYNEAAPPDRKRLKHLEENARSHLSERVRHLLKSQFEIEISRQHNEILDIDSSISKVQQKLQILRYVATRSFFSSKNLQNNNIQLISQKQMHPTVRSMLGKRPALSPNVSNNESISAAEEPISVNTTAAENIKFPRYLPPKIPEKIVAVPVRGEQHYLKKKLVVGNVSKWIPISDRDDTASHKWMVYVRGPKEEPNVSTFVSRVVFFLHPSYAPHDVVQVLGYPFHVTRRGWGEFPLRIQVHFRNPLCKPVNIIHNLKLDRSYTGLQTLGAETIVDVMVYDEKVDNSPILPVEKSLLVMDEKPQHFIAAKVESNHLCGTPEKVSSQIFSRFLQLENKNSQNVNIISHSAADKSNNSFSNPSSCATQFNKDSQSVDKIMPIPKIVGRDHDYFLSEEKINIRKEDDSPKELSDDPSKFGFYVQSQRGGRSDLTASSTSVCSIDSLAKPDEATKPVQFRCLNKSGTVFTFPLTLLRNIVIQPNRATKVGDPVLRVSSSRTGTQELCFSSDTQQFTGENLALNPSYTPFKTEAHRPEKLGVELKFANERLNLNVFLGEITSSNWHCVRDCIRALSRNIKLIDGKAEDPVYRSVRPFSSSSLEIFDSWNVGKKRSAEWTRAKLFRCILEKCRFSNAEKIWSTKTIMHWCRRQGYSPMSCWLPNFGYSQFTLSNLTSQEVFTFSKTEFPNLEVSFEENTKIEVLSLDDCTSTSQSLFQFIKPSIHILKSESDLTTWIVESVEKHGFKLGAELYEDFLIPFARTLLSRIWDGIAEDLLRRSLREAYCRTQGRRPDEVTLADTHRAMIRRPEFDVFTNRGLGSDICVYEQQKRTT